MLNYMHQHIIHTHVGIKVLHTIAVFLDQPVVSFYCRSHGLELFRYVEKPEFKKSKGHPPTSRPGITVTGRVEGLQGRKKHCSVEDDVTINCSSSHIS